MTPILETGFSCNPKPLYVSLNPSHLLSLVRLQAGQWEAWEATDIVFLVVWVHSGLGLEECGIPCGTLGWSQAVSCFKQQTPQGRHFCKLQHIVTIPLKQPLFLFWTHEVLFFHWPVSKMAKFLRLNRRRSANKMQLPQMLGPSRQAWLPGFSTYRISSF